jgi:hypothetical protein
MALESEPVTVTAPTLTVAWFHDPAEPEATARGFRWNGGGRGEEAGVIGQGIMLAGRRLPVYEFSQRATRSVSIPLVLPNVDSRPPVDGGWGDDWQGDLDYLAAMLESRRAWVYRDDRSRLLYGVLLSLPYSDQSYGTTVEVGMSATDFDESAFYTTFTALAEA